jgi:hypothetical protein
MTAAFDDCCVYRSCHRQTAVGMRGNMVAFVVSKEETKMKKIGLVVAAAAGLAAASILVVSAQAQAPAAQGKRLWQGFVEELQKIGAPPAPPAPAKAAPAKAAPKKVAAKAPAKKPAEKK